jgi:NADPH:quinone reductase-like Zn-dependent oxidoreductase
MKAIVITKYGPPEGLQVTEIDKPKPQSNEVLIKVYATTVTAGDVLLRKFSFPLRLIFRLVSGFGKNRILGHELAGDIEAVGNDVTQFREGDSIFASTGMRGGAYAEYICLPEDGMLALKPTNMTYDEAAAVPVGGNTALDLLRQGNIQSGQHVLIYGASGSVGTFAVQLAKAFGADVTGVCSTLNVDWVKALGADTVIDYTQEDFITSNKTYDVIFDAVRKLSESRSKKALNPNGVFLSVKSTTNEKPENLLFLKELIEAGKMKSVIDRCYHFEQIVEAHRYVEQGHKKGNVVLSVVRA